MTASLRPFTHSRSLRALGLMAWLMLVITSLGATPMAMGSAHVHASHAAMGAVGQIHASSHDCCDHHADGSGNAPGQACGCIGLCASAVRPAPAGLFLVSQASRAPAQRSGLHAPSAPTSPPLRPPAA